MKRLFSTSLLAICTMALAAGTASAQDPCGGDWEEGDACGGGDACGAGGDACGGGDEGAAATEGGGEEGGGGEAAADEGGGTAPGMTLPKGGIVIHALVEVNMSADFVGKPFSIAPDIWYGVSDKLTVGLSHSSWAATGFFGGVGEGLCLAGEDNGCYKVYNNLGLEAVYGVKEDASMSLAATGGLEIPALATPGADGDIMLMGIKLGVKGEYRTGKIGIQFEPNLYSGATERDAGNKEKLFIPVGAMYSVDAKLHAGVQTGIAGPLDGFGDAYTVPFSFGAYYMVSPKIAAGGVFSFLNLAGKNSSADYRSLSLILGYMM